MLAVVEPKPGMGRGYCWRQHGSLQAGPLGRAAVVLASHSSSGPPPAKDLGASPRVPLHHEWGFSNWLVVIGASMIWVAVRIYLGCKQTVRLPENP
jgi:hypothetical protein